MKKYIGRIGCWMRKRDGRIVCRKCHMEKTTEGHDPCLGKLPGVAFACCGHGVEQGYVSFENEIVIRFEKMEPDLPAFAQR